MTSPSSHEGAPGPDPAGSRAVRPMTPRSRHEAHRVASPLELFFDLCFVVAVAQAGRELVHAIAEHHTADGLVSYAMVFFALWWAWMNFTWFASAYDNDDALYRVVTLVQIAGVLVFAAGVPEAFTDHDFALAWTGYAIMRLALVTQWLRAAASCRGAERRMALRYATGVLLCQAGWAALLLIPEDARPWVFLVMVAAELSVPAWAEHARESAWHPHHIAERYGLFTIIVLGESVAAATVAVKSAADEHEALGELLPIAIGGLLLVFAAWWIYFSVPIHLRLRGNRQAFLWGYGHYLVFGSAAAIGVGLEVAAEQATGHAHLSARTAALSVTLPMALYLLTVWALHARHAKRGRAQQLLLPVSAVAVLCCTFTGSRAVLWAGLVAAATIAVGLWLGRAGHPLPGEPPRDAPHGPGAAADTP
ncbi:low temperature requirement protein A [Streptomyces sp. NA04227]|uniref:low temperature requirement protein A n=1 Tax=Streptomyces sp. NA04227 TaxID=2742136 RepID=UPI0015908879|nr:low temperature requirement protein A [Streptomyces sp. NA04227]QKW07149.1 low temperature requirement protein A [Streptomyces sp. NA04227]